MSALFLLERKLTGLYTTGRDVLLVAAVNRPTHLPSTVSEIKLGGSI